MYGFSLEHNKYDYLCVQLEYLPRLSQYHAIKRIPSIWQEVAKYKFFYVRISRFNVNMLNFVRMVHADMSKFTLQGFFTLAADEAEVKCLERLRDIYQDYLAKNFTKTLEQNQAEVTNPKLSYHQYFAAIYRTERQKIIHNQINLINIAIQLMKRMIAQSISMYQAQKDPVEGLETKDNYLTNRHMLKPLFNMCAKGKAKK